MKFRGTALMAAVFLGLALYYFFVDIPAEQKKIVLQEQAEKALPLETEEVLEFSVITKDDSITLKRNASHSWDLLHPLSAQGDLTAIETFLSEIFSLTKTRIVEEKAEDLSIYGLSSPAHKFHFKLKNKSEETLLLGSESPMGGSLYFKRKNNASVMLVSAEKSQFEKTVYHFRDKTLLTFSTATTKRIKIFKDENPLEILKKDNVWEISGPVDAHGDENAIMSFLQAIQFSHVKEFVNENPESLEPYGLNSPKIKLHLESEKGETQTIALGNSKDDKGYFGIINDSKNIVLLDTKLFQILSKKTVSFLDKTLVEFEENEAIEMTVKSQNETINLVRGNNDEWDITSPSNTTADLATVNSLLFDLKAAKVTQFINISLDIPKSFGLEAPKSSFSLRTKNGKIWKLQIGNESSDGKQVFANRTGESTVFVIPKTTVDKIFRSFHDLRNKKTLKFESEKINKISIKTPDKLFELKKTGPEWNLINPEKIKTGHIGNDLLWTLKGLEFNSIISPPLSANLTGLDSPSFTISLWVNDQEPVATLKVGKLLAQDQEYIAESNNQQYRIKNKYLDPIPLKLSKFKPL